MSLHLGSAGRVRVRRPLFDERDASRALDVAERLYAAALPHIASASGPPESVSRYSGAALVAEALARAGRGSDARLRAALREAFVFASDRLSLYDGAGSLAVAVAVVDPARASLGGVRAKLRDALAGSLRDVAPGQPGNAKSYELIGGPAGRAIALARATGEPVQSFAPFARDFADAVEHALASGGANGALLNLGVSHGVAGVLGALNVALPHERELARRYVDLLLRCSHDVGGARRWGAVWRPERRPSARRAWCYQTAGVAGVLGDRARIDSDDALRALASRALAALLDDPDPGDAPWDAALCHGRAGIASIAWAFADDADLLRHAQRLARGVLAEFDEGLPLGYRFASSQDVPEPRASFLDAALGVAQFLIDASTAQERRWLPLFGLTPD